MVELEGMDNQVGEARQKVQLSGTKQKSTYALGDLCRTENSSSKHDVNGI